MPISEAGIQLHISWIYTQDIDLTSKFFRDLMRFECLRETADTCLFRTTRNSAIGVCRVFGDRVVEPKGGMISLVTADVDALHARLLNNGAHIDEAPQRLERFGIYRFALRDPNGYVIEIQQFDDADWLPPA